MEPIVEVEEKEATEVKTGDGYVLLLHNDDVNTFDHVISSLVEVCNHEPEQAEQVAWIVHTKGKCDVKHGPKEKLSKPLKQLRDRQLSVTLNLQ